MSSKKCVCCGESRFNEFNIPKWASVYTLKNFIELHKTITFTVCPKCRRFSLNQILQEIVTETQTPDSKKSLKLNTDSNKSQKTKRRLD